MASEIKEINSKIKELKDILNGDNILTDDEIKDLEDKIESLKKKKLKYSPKDEIKEPKTHPKDGINKCTEQKIKSCKKNKIKKYCNPNTGECDKTEFKDEIKEPKTPPKDGINKCTEQKIKDCEKLKGKEIDELLKQKKLPVYGSKKDKCKRLLKSLKDLPKETKKIIIRGSFK